MLRALPRLHPGAAVRRHRPWWPTAAVLPAAVVVALLPAAPAAAAPPARETTHTVGLPECLGEADGVQAVFGARWEDVRMADSDLTLLRDGEVFAYDAGDRTVEWDGSVLAGSLTLAEPGDGEGPAEEIGRASYRLTLVADGPTSTVTTREGDGNRSSRVVVTRQPMRVTGGSVDVTVGEQEWSFGLTGCAGAASTAVVFASQPDTYVERPPAAVTAQCTSANGNGEQLVLVAETHGTAVEAVLAVVDGSTGDVLAVGFDSWDWSGAPAPFRGTVQLVVPVPEGEPDPPTVAAVVDLAAQKTGQTRTALVFQGGRDRISTEFFRWDGTVTADGFGTFSVTGCEGTLQTAVNRSSTPSGPQPGGPAPANDGPEAATVLTPDGRPVNAQTRGAAVPAEAPMSCLEYDPDPGHTVWFRFTGTGGPVTISPAGSSFNTVLAAYVRDGDELVGVECVDDDGFGTPSATTLAALTIDTLPGASYYVQAAGYAAQHGRLRLAAIAGR